MIKLAVNLSMIFTEVPLIERFALARAQGFDHVEIQFPYELSIEQIQTQLTVHNLGLCLINVPAGDLMQGGNGLAGIPGKEIAFHQAAEQAIAYAKALQVPSVNILAGKQPHDADLLPCLNTLASNLKMACQMFSSHGIRPVFEMINGTDMPRFLIQNIAQAQEILEAVAPRARYRENRLCGDIQLAEAKPLCRLYRCRIPPEPSLRKNFCVERQILCINSLVKIWR